MKARRDCFKLLWKTTEEDYVCLMWMLQWQHVLSKLDRIVTLKEGEKALKAFLSES